MVLQLAYSSNATRHIPRDELESLLATAAAYNKAHDVTGVLVYVDQIFLQILEGEPDFVLGLVKKIEQDPRHGNLNIFYSAMSAKRTFDSWRMALSTQTTEEFISWAQLEDATTVSATLAVLAMDTRRAPLIFVDALEALLDQ